MHPEITVILNCYRRPQNLEQQICALKAQTIPPKHIWLWVNAHPDNYSATFDNLGLDLIVRSSENLKYHGRFALGLLAQTEYVALFDDDTIPGTDWFLNCNMSINKLKSPAIFGSAGVTLLNKFDYMYHQRFGWPAPSNNIVEVDLVGHAWFFPKLCLYNMWSRSPVSLSNGEDIQLSAFNKQHGIKTYALAHPPTKKTFWGSIDGLRLGTDDKASSNGSIMPYSEFCSQRNQCTIDAINGGWKTIMKL